MSRRTLVVLQAYDPALPGVRTFYLTSGTGFTTTPSETPASQAFDPVLERGLAISRKVQGVKESDARPAFGEVVVFNPDGAYDAWAGYAFDGRAITVREGPETGAYPADFPVMWTGTMDRVDIERDRVVIRVRDRIAELDRPLTTETFLGDNVAPDGLEGDATLTDVVKPLVFGEVKNVPLTPVNAAKLIYHVSDTQGSGVQSVRDNGVLLGVYTPTEWGNLGTISGFTAGDAPCAIVTTPTALLIGGSSFSSPNYTPRVARTTDGSAFTLPTSPFTAGVSLRAVSGLAYDPALGRVCAVTTTGEIATSDDDGATWTSRTPAAAATYRGVRWDTLRGLFIAVGDAGVIHTSPTGVTWTAQTSGTTDALRDVAVDGPSVVVVGAGGRIVRSADGVTWATFTAGAFERNRCMWTGQYFLAPRTASGTLVIDRSGDGSGWVEVALPSPTASANTTDILRFNGWTLVGRSSSIGEWAIFTSNDSFNFTEFKDTTFTLNGAGSWGLAAFLDRFYSVSGSDIVRSGAPGTYATLADLEDDALAPFPGSYKWIGTASGTYVRLGSPPFGALLCDATHGATAADRTAGQVFAAVLTRAGYTAGAWSASDITALDTADNSVVGLYVEGTETVLECLDRLAKTVGAWWSVDHANVFRIQQLTAPSGSPTFTITDADIVRGSFERLASSDPLLGLPSYRTALRYALADTLSLDGVVADENTAVQTVHLLAQATEEETLYTDGADALAEAQRRQTLRGTMRHAYRVTCRLQDYASVALGAVGTLTYPRFGLGGGVLVRVLGIEPDASARRVTFTLWR